MKRWLLIVLWSLALHAQALQVIDDRGVAVDLPQPPQRVVSLLPSLTEMVCELVPATGWSAWTIIRTGRLACTGSPAWAGWKMPI